jgi:uncharacterized protein with NAD-binding domain and iron-sulfur cluster
VSGRRVVVLGGGAAALAAAFELSSGDDWQSEFESITVYQRGWRLGGKGASGRGAHGRVEEHGLHMWFGFYDNAFHLIDRCYTELDRAEDVPIRTVEDAFEPASTFVLTEHRPDGWEPWVATFPEDDRRPWRRNPGPPTLWELVIRALELALAQVRAAGSGDTPIDPGLRLRPVAADHEDGVRVTPVLPHRRGPGFFGAALGASRAALRAGSAVRELSDEMIGTAITAALATAAALDADPDTDDEGVRKALGVLVDEAAAMARARLPGVIDDSPSLRRQWYLIDILLACVRGVLVDDLFTHDTDAIDHVDFVDWLVSHGASEESARCPLITATVYDMAFAYRDGDPRQPACSAGTALRGLTRLFFDYKGALAWKMRAGMGDVVFAPLYEVLRKRGVRFEFFHRVDSLHLSADGTRIEEIRVTRQLDPRDPDRPYEPLVRVEDLPCWPAEPRWEQVVRPDHVGAEDLESYWSTEAEAGTVVLRDGTDFDDVVLGIGVGALHTVCADLVRHSPAWKAMVEGLGTVWTQAFQLWLSRAPEDLGDLAPGAVTAGFTEPFDTYADMPQVIPRESWGGRVKGVAYFCNAMPTPPGAPDPAEEGVRERADHEVFLEAVQFLDTEVDQLLPAATHRYPPGFRWELLVGDGTATGARRFATQYWRANVDPSDRYVQSLPGTSALRIRPGDSGVANLYPVGDWTDCGLNAGCVEAAVTSGMLASHALSGRPSLDGVVGHDHLRGPQ